MRMLRKRSILYEWDGQAPMSHRTRKRRYGNLAKPTTSPRRYSCPKKAWTDSTLASAIARFGHSSIADYCNVHPKYGQRHVHGCGDPVIPPGRRDIGIPPPQGNRSENDDGCQSVAQKPSGIGPRNESSSGVGGDSPPRYSGTNEPGRTSIKNHAPQFRGFGRISGLGLFVRRNFM